MDSLDVITVGGATIDLFLKIDPSNPHFKFNEQTKELSMQLGDKVVLDNAEFHIGGNAANVAAGIKKLGFKSSVMAELGNDEFADKIINSLNTQGVQTNLIKKAEGVSSFSVILNYKNDRTIFTEKVVKDHDFNFNNISTKWIYLTSLGDKWEGAYQKVSDFVRNNAINLAFNPGTTQIDGGISSFSYILQSVDVFFLNLDEAKALIGEKDVKDLLFELRNLGAKIVVITDGANGSYAASEGREVYFQKAIEVNVVSKTGAGDAYASGFLAAILSGKKIKEAMLWGARNSASVLSKIGAQTALLTNSQIQ